MPSTPDRIAYGLRVSGLPADAPLLEHPLGPRWPTLRIGHEQRGPAEEGAGALTIPFRGGGELRLDGPTATFITSRPPTGDELLHPHLAVAAAGRNRLLGREVLHAGAFVLDGAAWALAGPNGAGKSTLLAAIGQLGETVLSDDLLVLERGLAFAGPRCADLREPPRLTGHEVSRRVRGGERWRVELPPAPPSARFAGFVFLEPGDGGSALEPLPAVERVRRLAPLRRWPFLPEQRTALLDLATSPAYELRYTRSGNPTSAAGALLDAMQRHPRREHDEAG